jgi:hypothetical protein
MSARDSATAWLSRMPWRGPSATAPKALAGVGETDGGSQTKEFPVASRRARSRKRREARSPAFIVALACRDRNPPLCAEAPGGGKPPPQVGLESMRKPKFDNIQGHGWHGSTWKAVVERQTDRKTDC